MTNPYLEAAGALNGIDIEINWPRDRLAIRNAIKMLRQAGREFQIQSLQREIANEPTDAERAEHLAAIEADQREDDYLFHHSIEEHRP